MLTKRINGIVLVLLFVVSAVSVSCSKSKGSDCDTTSANLDGAIDDYNSSSTTSNCQAVIAAYNSYINSDCLNADEKSSYENERDAFKAAHCP